MRNELLFGLVGWIIGNGLYFYLVSILDSWLLACLWLPFNAALIVGLVALRDNADAGNGALLAFSISLTLLGGCGILVAIGAFLIF